MKKPNKGQFKPGETGNPAGKKPGTKNHATLIAQQLIDGEAEKITRRCIKGALAGEPVPLKLVLERLIPPRRSSALAFDLPPVGRAQDLPAAYKAILGAVAGGQLTATEAEALGKVLGQYQLAMETTELAQRLAAVEWKLEAQNEPR